MNILIIEDDAAIRQELKLLLENALYQVTVLTEFHHVVEDILQIEPDLLLLRQIYIEQKQIRLYSANRAGSASARCKSAAAIRI